MHQSTTPSLSQTIWPRWASRQFHSLPIVQTLLPVTFGYSLSSEAVVMRRLRRWKSLWRRSLTCSHKRTFMRPSRGCWNDTSALQPEKITSKVTRVSCVYYQIKVSKTKKTTFPSFWVRFFIEADAIQGQFVRIIELRFDSEFLFFSYKGQRAQSSLVFTKTYGKNR